MTAETKIRLGTRASKLARWQAEWTAARLRDANADVELIFITTEGDVKTGPIGEIGGQGLFTKRIQQALLDGEIDLAVHSLKDLPTEPVPGLALAAVPERESILDVLVSNHYGRLKDLPPAARVGTGSMRRRAQLLHQRPDVDVLDIRGNVDTRLRKLDDGEFDAIILAEAGLRRLGLQERIAEPISAEVMLPAIGQGALGLETRGDDIATQESVSRLNHRTAHLSVLAERALLSTLRGGCLAPVGAWARVDDARLQLDGVVLSQDGSQRLLASKEGPLEEAESIGTTVAEELLSRGAAALIEQSRQGE